MIETEKLKTLQERVMQHLDNATAMQLRLTEDDSAYTLDFLRQKLATCSTYQERLSDIMMDLTKVTIETTEVAASVHGLVSLKYNERKGSTEYREQPRDRKTAWLEQELQGLREEAEQWKLFKGVVSEVRKAVEERSQTMKRLDSSLRLHAKLIEMAPPEGRGPTSSNAYTGPKAGEVDID